MPFPVSSTSKRSLFLASREVVFLRPTADSTGNPIIEYIVFREEAIFEELKSLKESANTKEEQKPLHLKICVSRLCSMYTLLNIFRALPKTASVGYLSCSAKVSSIQSDIRAKLTALFKPRHLEIINDSKLHASSKGAETHFRISIVSQDFENLSQVMRHRLIKKALQDEFNSGLHALSIQAVAPSEHLTPAPSVPCIGHTKKGGGLN
ncbi:BolA-like protein 1 [Sparganum proliferum]